MCILPLSLHGLFREELYTLLTYYKAQIPSKPEYLAYRLEIGLWCAQILQTFKTALKK
jgi:hypothetical protein